MTDINTLRERAYELLVSSPASTGEAERGIASEARTTVTHSRRFSPFILEDAQAAFEIVDALMRDAQSAPRENGLKAAIDTFSQRLTVQNPALVRYAFMVFSTHNRFASDNLQPLPSLFVREPHKAVAGFRENATSSAVSTEDDIQLPASNATPPEHRLAWFREDILANEHHEHWHLVYPTTGVPDGNGNAVLKDRQGELFFYMHEQMLARYDAERLALGLERVRPLDAYREPVPEGYDPGPLRDSEGNPFSPRPAGQRMADLTGSLAYRLADHETRRERIVQAAEQGFFIKESELVPVTADLLGATEESTVGSVSVGANGRRSSLNYYGNHHGMGHVLLAFSTDPQKQQETGVMYDPATAIRDPVFYRWHKHIDDISFKWQQTQSPHVLTDAPPVVVRKGGGSDLLQSVSPDILLCFADNLPFEKSVDGMTLGEAAFGTQGGQNSEAWNKDFTDGVFPVVVGEQEGQIRTTRALETRLRTCALKHPQGGKAYVSFLQPRDFAYFLRLENTSEEKCAVTVRLWLVPAITPASGRPAYEDRRLWIEMDKFRHDLAPRQQSVVYRPSEKSSVVRKPVLRSPCDERATRTEGATPEEGDEFSYCTCGWPYHMLLPRGTEQGMPFLLLVHVTDWNIDRVPGDSCCGSFSFCGARDKYPDSRSMGYPFDRPFSRSIADTIGAQSNMATTPITIIAH